MMYLFADVTKPAFPEYHVALLSDTDLDQDGRQLMELDFNGRRLWVPAEDYMACKVVAVRAVNRSMPLKIRRLGEVEHSAIMDRLSEVEHDAMVALKALR